MKGRFVLVLLLSCPLLLLCGCWDYTEVELLDFVLGAGLDQVEPDFVVVTEMIKTSGSAQEAQVERVVLTTHGRSLSSAARALSSPAGRDVFWSHAQVFLVSEEVARGGVLSAIEYVLRSRHMRSTIYMFVTRDCTVEEVFKSTPPFNDTVSEHLGVIVDLHAQVSNFYPLQVWEFAQDLNAEGISGTLPTVQLIHERGEMVPIVKGTAVFKKDKMVGWLDGEESALFSLLKGRFQRNHFVMETRTSQGTYPITYQIMGNKVDIKPNVKGERPRMSIKIGLQLSVVEVGHGAKISFQDEKEVKSIEEQLAHTFNRRTRDLLEKLQLEYNADILGFGQLLRRKEPDIWRRYSENWECVFPLLAVDVEAKCTIAFTGLYSQPIIVRD